MSIGKHPSPSDYPRVPTEGWMRSELEAIGVPNRGMEYSNGQLVAMLRARGYDVYDSAAKKEVKDGRG